MELSNEDKAVLAHVVIDPDAWVAHALATVGEQAVTAKIEKYRAEYLAAKDSPDYKTRAAIQEANKPIPTYKELRAREYPDYREYLDGIVKGDQAQIDKYIADCLAVKAKYPKS